MNMNADNYKKPSLKKLGNVKNVTFENGGYQSSVDYIRCPECKIHPFMSACAPY